MWLQFRFLPCKLLNLSKSSGIFLDLLLCQGNEITVRGIPTDKKWTADDVITIPAVRLHSIYFSFSVDYCHTSISKTNALNEIGRASCRERVFRAV